MNVSLNWLKNYIDFDFSPEELADKLTMLGIEVESIKRLGKGLEGSPSNLSVGMSLTEVLDLNDVILELEITPNRSDCLSMLGVAREIRAETGNTIRYPEVVPIEGDVDIREVTSVTIEDPDLCPRYAARVIQSVQVAESPTWVKQRLESVGVATINNIVDITNLVLMAYGQPLHAFDYHKLGENRIVVRRAKEDETITTLDEVERRLNPNVLVIADAEKPVALAGVMGGFDSEITETTEDVLLESANFLPASIRSTSKELALHTEASYRFERGADPGAVITALDRASQLIVEIAGGTICKGVVDVYPGRKEPLKIRLRKDRVNFILGTSIKVEEIDQTLSLLGFGIEPIQTEMNNFDVIVPSFRLDITREIDLIEEIARVHGYDNIPTTLPKGDIPIPLPDKNKEVRKRIRNFLLSSGMMEAVNYSFIHPICFKKIRLNDDHPLCETTQLQNPLSPDMSILRTTLIPSLLENAQRNHNHQVNNILLFEISSVFINGKEPARVAGILAGEIGGGIYGNPYRHPDFFDMKGIVEGMLDVCGIRGYEFKQTEDSTYHPGRNGEVVLGKTRIGIMGELHPVVLENYEFPFKAYLFEFDLEKIVDASDFSKRFEPISIYPSIQRDLAIVVDQALKSDMPIDIINVTGGEWVESIRLFDVYEGNQVPDGKKSLAYTITYHSATETLTDNAVNDLHDKIVQRLNKEFGAELRM